MTKIHTLINEMIKYYSGDPKRIQHFLKVYSFAALIADGEGLDEETYFVLTTAAVVHDIGIKACEEKYGRCCGPLQELEGPPIAEEMLKRLGYEERVVERVKYLIAHHHTYKNVDGADYRILIEADCLVNLFEDGKDSSAALAARDRIFRTPTGIKILNAMFALAE